jgi:pimeloyl-ACP methyl ester carboxylesterase
VLLGGYYYPSMRADVAFAAPPALPVIGDLMRYTVSPFLASAMKPRIDKKLFAPAQVPDAWIKEFPFEVALRPSQIRAEAAEAALMIPGAASLEARLQTLAVPAWIVAGEGDEVVTTTDQSQRLHEALPDSTLQTISGAGHMVHHTATDEVVAAIRGAASRLTQQA